ncbi:MAG TPA: hypothetical protein VFW00_01895, partial [Rhodocyclaceae bacterium]|nr:hypothetical protein [Rhodocyclaceae bacterium]
DAWTWTLDYLRRTTDEASAAGESPDTGGNEDYEDELKGYANFASVIGRRLAELHAALAMPSADPAFSPAIATADDVANWSVAAEDQLKQALNILQAKLQNASREPASDDETLRLARVVLDRRQDLITFVRNCAAHGFGALRTRIHGDFHLGQILVVQGDAYLVDFEGEPVKSLEQRRDKSSPLRDVAGLLRSIDYAIGTASEPEREGGVQSVAATQTQRAALMQRFRSNAKTAFLAAYRNVLREAPCPWVTMEAEEPLLNLFQIEKAAYEICYEAANRPLWLGLPIRGLADLASRLTATDVAERTGETADA